MSYLVHPEGWRLYHKSFWKLNFFLKNLNFYYYIIQKANVVYTIAHKILQSLNTTLSEKRRNFIRFSSLKFFFFNRKNMLALVKIKLYWRSLFKEFSIYQNKLRQPPLFPDFRKKKKFSKKRRRYHYHKYTPGRRSYLKSHHRRNRHQALTPLQQLRFLYKDNFIWFITQHLYYERRRTQTIIPNYITFTEPGKYNFLFKTLSLFLYTYPYIFFFKRFLKRGLKKYVSTIRDFKIYFFGLNQVTHNPPDTFQLITHFLLVKNFSPVRTLYTVLRILKKYKERQGLTGYKLLLAGRFTRRDRAIYLWKAFDKLSLNSKYSDINYYSWPLQLIYSKCVIKLWLSY